MYTKLQISIFFLLFVLPISTDAIPDSLLQQLNEVEGAMRLEVWKNWGAEVNVKSFGDWEEISQIACVDASEFLDRDSSLVWCFQFHFSIYERLITFNDFKGILDLLKITKPMVDSLINMDDRHEALLVDWYMCYGNYHYINLDLVRAEDFFKKALDLNEKVQDQSAFFNIWNALAIIYIYGGQIDKGLACLDKAELVDPEFQGSNVWLRYYRAFAYKEQEKYKAAHLVFLALLGDLKEDWKEGHIRIKMDYGHNLCLLGQPIKGIEYLEELRSQLDTSIFYMNLGSYLEFCSDCEMLAGNYAKGMRLNKTARKRNDAIEAKRRSEEVLKWQTKLEVSEKEKEIQKLEQEKIVELGKSQNKLIFLSFFGLIGLGILSFFLLQNKNKQKQLSLILEKDRQISENRDRLFSSITHDIRTPLALMLAPLERAELQTQKTEVKADIQLAQRNGKYLMELFNQILDWNKAEAKAMTLNPQVGQIELMLNRLCQRYEQQAIENGIKFKKSLNCPPGYILLDFDKMDKILANLIGNAIKFSEVGAEVILNVKTENQMLHFEVSDQGLGMEIDKQQDLFNEYVQGVQGKKRGGVGLGLALVKHLVVLMNGKVEVQSAPGKGTSFQVDLPFETVEINEIEEVKEEVGKEKKEILLKLKEKPLLLIIEDEPELREFLRSALTPYYEVEVANTAAIGLSLAIDRVPDLIISDWTLPDNNGDWICRNIRKNDITAHIPILILSAFIGEAYRQEAFEAGAVAWMDKPFKLENLYQQLGAIAEQQKKLKQKMLHTLQATNAKEERTIPLDPFLQKVIAILDANYTDESFSIEKMAGKLFLSRVQFFRKIKSITGDSPSTLLRQYRLGKARQLLQQNDYTVAEVSFLVGFSNPSYFSRAYKQYYKNTPSQEI